MTHPDFRALCAELLAECRSLRSANPANPDLWDRARAALAAEPKRGIQLTPPPDLLSNAVSEWSALPLAKREALSLADHVATAAYQAGARAALAAEPGEGISDEEIRKMWLSGDWFNEGATLREFASIIRRYTTHPAPAPVPLAERLPGEGDCDAGGWCWMWEEPGGCWWQVLIDAPFAFQSHTHWLPCWALPLPEVQP